MKKKLVGMLATATLLTMALAGNVQAAEIRSVGPDGEAAVDASTIELTDDQIAQIKEGGYTAAICLHYGGNDWSTSQQKGLEDTFGELGIEIVAVTDANFSAETQVSNIETVWQKNLIFSFQFLQMLLQQQMLTNRQQQLVLKLFSWIRELMVWKQEKTM